MSNRTVAILGRPNVGKSSLFNRLVGKNHAIVSPIEGITRDRIYGNVEWVGEYFDLIDTGGFYTSKEDDLEDLILIKAHEAIATADLILLVVDKKFGLSPYDKELANILRKSGKEVVLVINKIDVKTDEGTQIFHELGFETKIEV